MFNQVRKTDGNRFGLGLEGADRSANPGDVSTTGASAASDEERNEPRVVVRESEALS
jgi:hypothetical protein